MSTSLSVKGYSSKDSKEFQKHFKAVKFCIENGLSYPKETAEFFKGKLGGDDLDDITPDAIIQLMENGIEVKIPIEYPNPTDCETHIKVSSLPPECDLIIVKLLY